MQLLQQVSPLRASYGLQVWRGLLLCVATRLLLELAESFHQRWAGMGGRIGSGVVAGGEDHTSRLLWSCLLQRHLCPIHCVALGHGLQEGIKGEVSAAISTWIPITKKWGESRKPNLKFMVSNGSDDSKYEDGYSVGKKKNLARNPQNRLVGQ